MVLDKSVWFSIEKRLIWVCCGKRSFKETLDFLKSSLYHNTNLRILWRSISMCLVSISIGLTSFQSEFNNKYVFAMPNSYFYYTIQNRFLFWSSNRVQDQNVKDHIPMILSEIFIRNYLISHKLRIILLLIYSIGRSR